MIAEITANIPLQRQPKPYTLSDYLVREERTIHKHIFLNGQIIRAPSAKTTHNEIATNITFAIKTILRQLKNRLLVYNSDQKIYIEAANVVVYPDALVICEKPIFWNGREDLIVNPLVVVEVLSESTRRYDKGGKFLLYKQAPTLREYVTVEQKKPLVESWFRLEKNTWDNSFQTDISQSFELRSIGVSISLSDIYENIIL